MKLAVLSDIHANLEALTACLDHARQHGATHHAFLGDLVGYGADPCACLDLVRRHAAAGAVVVVGNHDAAALGGLCAEMHPEAREAIVWTRSQLGEDDRSFLAGLPETVETAGCCFVHASTDRPRDWAYLDGKKSVARCLAATAADLVFAGHVHEPTLYFSTRDDVRPYQPVSGIAIPLLATRRWLALVGSVGQPRDGNPAASYAMLDRQHRQLCFYRVPYDWMRAASKIRAAGLPAGLAARLEQGT